MNRQSANQKQSAERKTPTPDISFDVRFPDGLKSHANTAMALARLASAARMIADDADYSEGATEHQRLAAISAIAEVINGIAYSLMEASDAAAE